MRISRWMPQKGTREGAQSVLVQLAVVAHSRLEGLRGIRATVQSGRACRGSLRTRCSLRLAVALSRLAGRTCPSG